jgi:hypothetical protein
VSRKAGKRTKAAKALSLDDPHWWTLDKTRSHCHEHMGDRRVADLALLAAVNAGELPGKIVWVDEQISPPALRRILLSVEDYELRAVDFYKVWLLQPRRPDVPVLPRPALFFWGPRAEELWLTEAAEPETEAQQRQKPGTKAIGNWPDLLTRELIRVAFEAPELIRDRDKLVRHLRKTLKAEIKGWDLSQNKAIHQTLNHLLNRIASLGSNSP